MSILATLSALVTVAVGTTVFLKNKHDNEQEDLIEQKNANTLKERELLNDKLRKKLDKDSDELKQNTICYYMHNFYLGEDVSTSLIDEIKKEYKVIYSLPYIDFLSYHLVGQEINIFDEILEQRLKNHSKDEHKNKKQRYESMLQEEAKEEALKGYEKLKQEFSVL